MTDQSIAMVRPRFRVSAPVVALFLVALFVLSACGGRPSVGALEVSIAPAEGTKDHDILIVTTREKDNQPDTYFSGERGSEVSFAEAVISVPPTHKPGAIEWPSSLPGDPETEFVTRSASYISDEAAFTRDINQRLAKLPKGEREIFLFIHGYNTRFPEALFRFTQIVNDADLDAVPVLFTWASRGKVQDYIYDLNSAAIARQALQKTMLQLSRTNADKINILAHSMGNWLLMEAAIQTPPEKRKLLAGKLQDVVLAAPDIDIDLFKAQLKKLGPRPRPYMVIVSRDDRALRLSRAIAGGKERVGAYSNDQELAELGAVVVDVTDLQSLDSSHHSKFAQLAEFSPQFRETLGQSGLTSVSDMGGRAKTSEGLGDFIGNTVTLPIRIIAAPVTLAGGG
ncbi:alpha/beta hydrolase [Roseibium sp. SCP14]|uniref:alpha/beta hydrolase n=1 Tax=Roseibium sp. SCP14 TaxID=3141375 RepID=UPI003335E5D2